MRRALPLLLLAPLAAQDAPPAGDFEVRPRTIEWAALSPGRFDLRYRLPERRATAGPDLVADMERLVALRFEWRADAEVETRTLGDLVAAARPLGPKAREAWWKQVERRAPALVAEWDEPLRQLLFDDTLYADGWDPDDDDGRDGIVQAESRDLSEEAGHPWTGLEVAPLLEQAAVLMFAEPAAIKAAENDYRAYLDDVGSDYEEIWPVPDGYARGEDPRGNAFAAVRIRFRCELPLWYPDYECDLRILSTVDRRGRLVTDIYSRSEDFHWLAGRDVYLPVETSAGERVATLVVRLYGFDIDDVPDKVKHRRAALRGSLGNLRRRAERRQATGRFEPAEGEVGDGPRVPPFRVLGRR